MYLVMGAEVLQVNIFHVYLEKMVLICDVVDLNFNTFLYMLGLLLIVTVVLVDILVVVIMIRILEEIERRKNGNK